MDLSRALGAGSRSLAVHWVSCIFMKGSGLSIIVLLVYVDDMVIMSESKNKVESTKRALMDDF